MCSAEKQAAAAGERHVQFAGNVRNLLRRTRLRITFE
jgi:hypothetical protein